MNNDIITLSFNEKVTFALRSLYMQRGYLQYKMGKFEEYDLYARNKDFLNVRINPEPTHLGEKIPISGNGDVTNDKTE